VNPRVATGVGASPCLLLALVLASTTGVSSAPTTAPRAQGGLPDLVVGVDRLRSSLNIRNRSFTASSCAVFENCVGGTGTRRVLEYDTQIINQGTADVVFGSPADHPELYEFSPCHSHYHLKDSLDYSLAFGGTTTAGVYDAASGQFQLRNSNTSGVADITVPYGVPAGGYIPLSGDWDGDGDSTIGLYDPAAGAFYLRNSNTPGNADLAFVYGPPAAGWRPLIGDWDGSATDTVGLYDPSTGVFYLRNSNAAGAADLAFSYGPPGSGWLPVAGDWDGDDFDTIGLYDPTGAFYLRNTNAPGAADAAFLYGPGGVQAVVGDWDANGIDTIGVFDAANATFHLRNTNTAGPADVTFNYGAPGALAAVVGDFDYEAGPPIPNAGHKEAFCWIDSQRIFGNQPAHYTNCNNNQGITQGWADIYGRGLDCQWIDITGLAAGNYQLRVNVNDLQLLVVESDYTNNTGIIKVHIPAAAAKIERPRVKVLAPKAGESFNVGEPLEIRWRVRGGEKVTHQELWLMYAHPESQDPHNDDDHDDGHLAGARLIDGNIAPDVRSYLWTPTEDFIINEGRIVVRTQDDVNLVGTDTGHRGRIKIRQK
jgi:hypothetical protein